MNTLPRPLISAEQLLTWARSGAPLVLLDCGFDLADAGAGERAHAAGHLPGAHYLHLDRDLAGPKAVVDGRFPGRHPLPARAAFAALAGALGIAPGVAVVAYDAQGGPYAARAWWLLRWLGHDEVAVLDGGPAAWQAAGGALESGGPVRGNDGAADHPAPAPAPGAEAGAGDAGATPRPADAGSAAIVPAPYPASATPAMATIDAAALRAALGRVRLIDARAGERFRGEIEPLDAAAGHIPGALNRFFKDNLGPDGRFKPREQLHAELAPLAAGAATVVQQCGSGVTACHNLLAFAHAGLGDGVLYPGSWSEWSSDPTRPVARGG